jgi:1-acyl-sn-glycerol-3-phosphate acyltransferase
VQPLKPGIHLLIKRTAAAIVPVGIAGAYEAWPCSRPAPMPAPLFLPARAGTIGVAIGPPEDARHYAALPREKAMQELFARIDAMRRQAEVLRRKA